MCDGPQPQESHEGWGSATYSAVAGEESYESHDGTEVNGNEASRCLSLPHDGGGGDDDHRPVDH